MWQHSNSKDNSTSGVLLTTPMAPKQASGPLVHDQGVDGDGLPGWVLTPLPFVQAQREAIVRCFCCVKPVRLQVAWVTSGKLKFYAVSAVMWHRSQNQPRQCKVTEVGFIKKIYFWRYWDCRKANSHLYFNKPYDVNDFHLLGCCLPFPTGTHFWRIPDIFHQNRTTQIRCMVLVKTRTIIIDQINCIFLSVHSEWE